MFRAKLVGIGVVAVALVALLGWRLADGPPRQAAAPTPLEAARTVRGVSSAPAAPAEAPLFPGPEARLAAPVELPVEGRMAIDRFAMESIPQLDACMGPVNLERAPVPMQATFTLRGDTYVLRGAQPLPGGPELHVSARRCLDVLVGRPLALDPAAAGSAESFTQLVTWTLPASPRG
ncbi:MAG: hypothetical protein Q8P18_01355 [Pseudomonadota bacterium]|nr:hypothetical protein [Pseudomonadota bacterium]